MYLTKKYGSGLEFTLLSVEPRLEPTELRPDLTHEPRLIAELRFVSFDS